MNPSSAPDRREKAPREDGKAASSPLSPSPPPPTAPPSPPKTPPPRPKRPWWRRWLRRLLALGFALLAFLLLVLALIPYIVSSRFTRNLIVSHVEKFTDRPAGLEGLRFRWTGAFGLDGFHIGPKGEEPNQPLLAIGTVRVRWGWMPFFSRKLRLDECTVEGFRLTIHRDAAGVLNLLTLVPPPDEPKPPPKEPGEPFQLQEWPIEKLHVALRDWRIDFIDDATTRPLRAGYVIDTFTLDHPSASEPTALSLRSALYLGDETTTLPVDVDLAIEPSAAGYLDWQGLATRLVVALPEQSIHLDVGPRPESAPGLGVDVRWRLTPSVFLDFAERGLALDIPAAIEGPVEGHCRVEWDAATSMTLRLETTWRDPAVQADAVGSEPLRIGDITAWFALATLPRADDAPAFADWSLGPMGVRSPYLEVESRGTVKDALSTETLRILLAYEVRHAPASLEPLLAQFGIALPEQVGLLREVAYSGYLRGGMTAPLDVAGLLEILLAPLAEAPDAPPDAPPDARAGTLGEVLVGLHHQGAFDFAADRFDHRVVVGERRRDAPASGELWRSDPWMTLNLDVAPVLAPDRRGALGVALQPGPFVDLVTHLGLAPEGFPTTGSLAATMAFAQSLDGGVAVEAMADGALGVTPRLDPEGPLPMPALGMGPLSVWLDAARLEFRLDADGAMDLASTGGVGMTMAYDTPASMPLHLATTLALPARWDLEVALPKAAPIRVDATLDATPAVRLAGDYSLDVAQPVHGALVVAFDPETQAVALSELAASVGEWLHLRAEADVEQFGTESIRAALALDVFWEKGLLEWIPPEVVELVGGRLVLEGLTRLTIGADGRWDPERGTDPVRVAVRLDHEFGRLGVGPEAEPLLNARDWTFGLQLDASVAPDEPLRPLTLEATAAMSHTDSLGLALVRDIAGRVALAVDPRGVMPVDWDVEASIGHVAAVAGPLPLRLGPYRMGTKGRVEVQPLDVNLETAWFEAPGLLVVRADARFTSATQTLAFHADAEVPSIGAWVALPTAMIKAAEAEPLAEVPWVADQPTYDLMNVLRLVPPLDGSVGGSISVEGTVPTPEDIAALDFPLVVRLRGGIEDFTTTLDPPASTRIEGFRQAAELVFEGSRLAASAPGGIDGVHSTGALDYSVEGIHWDGAADLDLAAGTFGWRGVELALPELGVRIEAEGGIDGWGETLRALLADPAVAAAMQPADWIDWVRTLVLRAHSNLVWESPDWMTFDPSDAEARGRAEFFADFHQEPGREVRSVLGAAFRDFALRVEPFQAGVSGMTGELEMLVSGRRDVTPPPERALLTETLLGPLDLGASYHRATPDGLTPVPAPVRPDQRSVFRIADIVFQQWAIRGITLISDGDLHRWTIHAEIEDFMSGKVKGLMRIEQAPDGGWDLEVEAELTGVSGRSAIPAWRDLSARETEVGGVGHFRWHLAPDARTPEELLRGIDIRFVVTHIGSRALQSFILALDPEEKNPSFVAGRQALNLGRPNKFVFTFRNGLMDMEAGVTTFTGLGLSIPLLKRAAVGELFRLEALEPQLRAVMLLKTGLDALAALDAWVTPAASNRFQTLTMYPNE